MSRPAALPGGRVVGSLLAVAVLVVGLSATLLVVSRLRADDRDSAAMVMNQRTAVALAAVTVEAARYLDLLRTVAAGVGANDKITATDFQAATAPLVGARLWGVTSVGYAVSASSAALGPVQQFWRQRGAAGLVLSPQGRTREHIFTVFSRPLNEPGRPGFDISAADEAAAALDKARASGAPAVSDTYILMRDRDRPIEQQQLSFVFVAPVYASVPATPGGTTFRGWIVMGLHGQDFLGGVLRDASQGMLDAELRATNGDGRQVQVAAYVADETPELRRTRTIRVADRTWTLLTGADPDNLPGAHSSLPVTVLLGGMTIAVVLAGLVYALASGRSRAQARVLVATAELRVAEAEARRQAGLLGAVMASIGDGVGVVDGAGVLLLYNPAARQLLGDPAGITGPDDWQQHYGLYRPDGRTPFPVDELPMVKGMHGESSDGVEMMMRNPDRPDGILLSVDGRPLDSSAGQHGAVAVFRDITELRRYETDLSAFAGVVAHDLRAPLAVIRGHCETAADVLGDEPDTPGVLEVRASLARAAGTVDRMAGLIETLLAYTTSRDAPLRLRVVALEPLVAESVAGWRLPPRPDQAAAPDIYLGPLPTVTADPGMLRHVFDNLIGNAVKYVRPDRAARVDITASTAEPGWARIEIADRGIGIGDEDKTRIFESFHRAGSAAGYAGTGLGLAICRRIIERHGGTIGVTDNPGGGTRFHFTLPTVVPAAAPPGATQPGPQWLAWQRVLAERAAATHGVPPDLPGADLPTTGPGVLRPAAPEQP